MKEILTLGVGNCGCHVGLKYWEVICDEHGVDTRGAFIGQNDLQVDKIDSLFQEATSGRYVPRSILIDTNIDNMQTVQNSCVAEMFRPENLITGNTGSSYNYGKGFKIVRTDEGQQLMSRVIDSIYSELETCDNLHCVQFLHAIGGGTGSGMGSFLLQSLYDIIPKKCISSFTLVPSPALPEAVVEPYNTILTVPYLEKITDMTFLFDNEALLDILQKKLNLQKPTYSDANYLIATMMSGLTASMRFPGQINISMCSLASNVVPQPKLHYLTTAVGPLINECTRAYTADSIKQLTHGVLEPKSMFAACEYRRGVFLALGAIFRGHVSTKMIELSMHQIRTLHKTMFPVCMKNNIKTAFCDIPPRTKNNTFVTFVANHTALVTDMIARMHIQIQNMFPQRKAFFHWFEEEGITEDDLKLASEITLDVIAYYRQFELL